MTQKFTAEEVREKAHGYSLRGDDRTAAMLNAYADTLSKPASPAGVPDGKCVRCNGTGEYMDYRGNMSQMEKCYVCDGSGTAAPSAPEGDGGAE